ncbi:unnamed protein product, partial [Acanthoscelides obtectus]
IYCLIPVQTAAELQSIFKDKKAGFPAGSIESFIKAIEEHAGDTATASSPATYLKYKQKIDRNAKLFELIRDNDRVQKFNSNIDQHEWVVHYTNLFTSTEHETEQMYEIKEHINNVVEPSTYGEHLDIKVKLKMPRSKPKFLPKNIRNKWKNEDMVGAMECVNINKPWVPSVYVKD